MDARTWESAKELLANAADLPATEQRAYIERHCTDPTLRRELLEMVAAPAALSSIIAGALTLAPGAKLGPYEILAPLGAGGMGEVYKARDARLGRDVAIKVLPLRTSTDPHASARFTHEARAIAALSDPHICAIYDVGEDGGRPYFVMELLDGESLHERLRRGPVTGADLLDYAIALADALDAAHACGVIHRDLKPSNIIVTTRGELKILDFGLAKLLPSFESTRTRAVPLTAAGSGVGTLAYMSPEQMRGEEVDARSDLFTLGAVLYEMATGRPAFDGRTAAVVANAILNEQPEPVIDVYPSLPASLDFVIDKALEKDRALRYQNARTLRADLARVRNEIAPARNLSAGRRRRLTSSSAAAGVRRHVIPAAMASVCLVAGIALGFLARNRTSATSAPLVVFSVPKQSDQHAGSFALSPDGRHLAYVDRVGTTPARLYLRSLGTTESHALSGTDGAEFPFWSPDSRAIAFFAGGALRRIGVAGGLPQTICRITVPYGGTWNQEDLILFADKGGLYTVPALGGAASVVLADQLYRLRWPQFLPDGQRYLYFHNGGGNRGISMGIRAGSLGSTDTREVMATGYMGRYAPPGYLLYVHEGSLVARRFDLRTLESGGEEIVVAERLGVDNSQNFRNAGFSIANGASLVFGNDSEVVRLQWLDRAGTPAGSNGPTDLYWSQELSPDGTRVALEILDETGQADIWTLDLVRDTRQRLTRTPGVFEYSPRWSPDGLHIAYSSTGPADTASIRQRLADGSAGEEVVAEQTPRLKFVSDWWHDGRAILVRALSDPGRSDGRLVSLATSKDRQAPLAPLPADQLVADARFSPNGDWIAYVSNQTGQDEVYIQLVAGGRPTPVSTAGGEFPSWRGDGEELFYVAPGNILTAVTVKWRGDIALGLPKGLFRLPSLSADVLGRSAGRRSPYTTRDGLRFLVRMRPQETSPPLTWVLNWTARMPR